MENVLELITLRDIGPVSYSILFRMGLADKHCLGHLHKCPVSETFKIKGNRSLNIFPGSYGIHPALGASLVVLL